MMLRMMTSPAIHRSSPIGAKATFIAGRHQHTTADCSIERL
jgi:hypothetical protein